MAMSGGIKRLVASGTPSGWPGPISLYVYYKESSQSITGNTTTLSLGMYVTTPSGWYFGSWTDFDGSYVGTATSGSNCKTFDGSCPANTQGTRWLVENQNITISHGSDGKKSVTIYWKWGVYSTWAGILYPSGSFTIDLTDIDRTAPTVSFSVGSITTKGFKISATSNATCNKWDYSLDGGETWTNFSTESGTSASVTLSSLAVNTSYSVKVRARRSYNYVVGTSSAKSVKTLGYAIINSCSAFYSDASTVTVKPNITVYDADFTVAFNFKNGTTTLFTIAKASYAAGTSVRTLTLTAAQRTTLLNAMSTCTSLSLTIEAITYDGSTSIGKSVKSATAKTSSSTSKPTFTGFTFADVSELVDLTGDSQTLIQGYSSLKVTANAATAKNGAYISNYTATIANKTAKSTVTEFSLGAVNSSGDLELTVSAVDSRGYSTSVTKTVKVLPYAKPKIKGITLRRANGIDPLIQLSFNGTMSTIKPDGETDVNGWRSVTYRYKETGLGDEMEDLDNYSEYVSITSDMVRSSSGTSFSFATNELMSLDVNKSYYFRIVVRDLVAYSVNYYVIPKGIPLLAPRKDKLGVMTPDPQHTLDVGGDVGFVGGLYNEEGRNVAGDTGWVDLGLSSEVSATEESYGHHHGCAYRVVGENHVYVAFGCAAEWAGSSITVNGSNIPSAYRPERTVYALVPLGGKYIARIYVSYAGNVAIEWVQNLLSAEETTERSIAWIDGYIDYWI